MHQESEQPALLTPVEVARRLRVTTRTIHRWSDRGILPAQMLPNGQRRYRVEDVDAALKKYEPTTDGDASSDDDPARVVARGAA